MTSDAVKERRDMLRDDFDGRRRRYIRLRPFTSSRNLGARSARRAKDVSALSAMCRHTPKAKQCQNILYGLV
ncbi:hypothetical protein WOLCODRAFT_26104 [Wolfiporia cocos MD-104 SS10]|uniref:Uncharacterized protein n=1 Tax=Wolfiporia cocos (strain MD-104) TaxID=742152 RepID=A0A2H3JXM8_WOLCO|nr:hypothetical protein WOLCODRAFT_26104 [Wolfiporia cocos MD-104 SS10]